MLRALAKAMAPTPLLKLYRQARVRLNDREPPAEAFSRIYRANLWGSDESRSGLGSTLEATAEIRTYLPELLRKLEVRSLLDAPCGDFAWMRHVDLGVEQYIGGDVVPELVAQLQREYEAPGRRFVQLDITEDQLPATDAILCRQCLIHLSNRRARKALENFGRSGARWLLTTSYRNVRENVDIETGSFRRIDLRLSPFGLGIPDQSMLDGDDEACRLDLYDLERLRRTHALPGARTGP